MKQKSLAQELAEKTLKELGVTMGKSGKLRKAKGIYGKVRERLREYTGQEIHAEDLTYEIFYELINKTDYLLKRAVEGLQKRIVSSEKSKVNTIINIKPKKYW